MFNWRVINILLCLSFRKAYHFIRQQWVVTDYMPTKFFPQFILLPWNAVLVKYMRWMFFIALPEKGNPGQVICNQKLWMDSVTPPEKPIPDMSLDQQYNQRWFCPWGNIWQCLETLLVMTIREGYCWHLTSRGWEILLTILQGWLGLSIKEKHSPHIFYKHCIPREENELGKEFGGHVVCDYPLLPDEMVSFSEAQA